MENFEVKITETALSSLRDIESFKAQYIGEQQAKEFAVELLLDSVAKLEEGADLYPICARLADKGVRFHERFTPDGKYSILYELDGEVAKILLFTATKQDLELLLYRHIIAIE
ncbi:hypothetical protein [Shewanella algae]|uniref:type II toxin-antitoxin system RelE/ParE family toxin n=1 Tax=Shewanella algae TaxID=38313 RepID=UPI0031F4E5B8